MRTACCGWMLLALLLAGCFPVALPADPKPVPPPPVSSLKPLRSAAPVNPAQISRENAREKAEALLAELDRESDGER